MATEPTFYLPTLRAGAATDHVLVPGGATAVAVGVAPLDGGSTLGSAVFRIERAITSPEAGSWKWFDAGTGLDLSATTTSVLVPVTGFACLRVVVRTAANDADDQVGVWIGAPA